MKKVILFFLLQLFSTSYAHFPGDYKLFGFSKFMSCEGDLGNSYLKLEKKWFGSIRVFQKEDGIWNELCLEQEDDLRSLKKDLTIAGGKCEYEEVSEEKGKKFYGFIFDFEFGEFEFYTFDLSPNYDSNFTENSVYTCKKVEPF